MAEGKGDGPGEQQLRPAVPTRALIWIVGAVVLAALIAALARQAGLLDRYLIFFPESEVLATPGDYGLAYEDVWLETRDGVRLHGWIVRPAASPGGSTRVVLWLHGNSGNIGHRAAAVAAMARGIGVPVMIIDYRGYGQSEGSPAEEGLYRDAEAAYDYLAARPEFSGSSIVAFGRSLGAAVAVELAIRRQVEALVLESPFTSVSEMARLRNRFLPSGLLVRARFDTLAKMPEVRAPVLVFHGTDDEIVPVDMGRRVHEAAPGRKRLYLLEGAMHNDPHHEPGAPYYSVLSDFLEGGSGG